jgi:hypothetical protein
MHSGPHIKRDGLVFGYDTGYSGTGRNLSKGRHFKGPASSNILEVLNHSRSNTSGANGFVLNGEETVNIPRVGKRSVKYVEYYNNHSNAGSLGCCPNLFYYHSDYITGVESSTPYTYSIIYKHTGGYTHPNFMYRYEYQTNGTYNTEGGLHSTASDRRRHLGNGWYHAWGTFTTRSNTTQLRCFSFLYNYGTTKHRFYVAAISLVKNTSGSTHLITPPQLMLKPNTSVSSTQSLIDLTKTTDIDVSNVSFDSTGQPTFDGTDDEINTGITTQLVDFSCVVIFKNNSSAVWGRLVDKQYNTGFFISSYFATGGSGYVGAGIIEPNPPHGQSLQYDTSKYNYFVVTRSGTTHTIYLNGSTNSLSKTGSGAALSSNEMAIGAWNGSTSSQRHTGEIPVVKLYNRALSAQEVQQNYRAYKNRFDL